MPMPFPAPASWHPILSSCRSNRAARHAGRPDLTVRQLKEAQQFKPTLKCGFVVSRKITGTVLGRDARAMAGDAGIPIFETEIEQRVAYAEALTMGKTIFEWGS